MQDEGFCGGPAGQTVQFLYVPAGSQSRHDKGLRFAAGKDGGSVNAWNHARFTADFAQVGRPASIGALALLQNIVAINFFLDDLESHFGVVGIEFLSEFFFAGCGCFFLDGVDRYLRSCLEGAKIASSMRLPVISRQRARTSSGALHSSNSFFCLAQSSANWRCAPIMS